LTQPGSDLPPGTAEVPAMTDIRVREESTAFVLTAMEGDLPVGQAVLEPVGVGAAAWLDLRVDPEHRSKTTGGALMTEALRQARERGVQLLQIPFPRASAAALALLRRHCPGARLHAAGTTCIAEVPLHSPGQE
jgi:GNAT superfamily N-acetyltransferase